MSPVRRRAAAALVAVERGRRTLAAELETARKDLYDERDRGLLMELAVGTCRWQAECDAVLEQFSSRPLAAIDEFTRATLRVALYQLRHLDRVPPHAVVHAAVDGAKALVNDRAGGFVNGVLRAYLRAPHSAHLPPQPEESSTRRQRIDYLNITLSHPRWLVARWLDRYGFDTTEAWCQFNNTAPEPCVRALDPAVEHTAAWLVEQGVAAAPSLLVPDMARLLPGMLGQLPAELREQLAVQDDGSALVADAVDARPDDRVLDVCAAPGGKAVRLWRAMDRRGLLIAGDVRPARVHLLRQTLRAAGVPPRVLAHDGSAGMAVAPVFDRILVDAPCSGLGTLRRDPDLKWSSSLESLPALADAQLQLLTQAVSALAPEGQITYATCSSEPEENEGVVARFLAAHPAFILVPWTGAGAAEDGTLRTVPPRDRTDAFFAARLRRRPA
jgi:16S rRNA (cytosine967-C5)-methyltransferase